MENDIGQKSKRSHRPDRITLDQDALQRVEQWTKQIQNGLRGSQFCRSDLVNELIKRRPTELTSDELKSIASSYFDPAKALMWAANEIKNAKKNGIDVDVKELLSNSVLNSSHKMSSHRKKRKIKSELAEQLS